MIATMYYFLLMVLYVLVFQISNVGALDLVNTGVEKNQDAYQCVISEAKQ